MLIKFTKHGKGSARLAAAYLLDDKDHLNRTRGGVEILAGDPRFFSAICESSKHKWKYTSAVIAFAPEDDPSPAQLRQVLSAFEKYAFAGLSPQRYHLFAVLHTDDDGSKHIHVLIPRLELETKRSLNIAPPGHHKYFDPLRDYFNYKNGWARPDDPARAKDTQEPNCVYLQRAAAIATGLKDMPQKTVRQQLDEILKIYIQAGLISSHQDVIQALKDIDGITAVSPSKNAKTPYISIKLDGRERPIRLKGAFYEPEFCVETYRTARTAERPAESISTGARESTNGDAELAEQSWQRAKELYKARKKYYRELCSSPPTTGGPDKRTDKHNIAELAGARANADELATSQRQQGRGRQDQTADSELSQGDRTTDSASPAISAAAAGSAPESAQQTTGEFKEQSQAPIYGSGNLGVISHPALLHVLCEQNPLYPHTATWSSEYNYWRAANGIRKISIGNPAGTSTTFPQPPIEEVNTHEQQRAQHIIIDASRAIEYARTAFEQAERVITATELGANETKQRVEKLKRRCRQLLQSIRAKEQPASKRERQVASEDLANAEFPAVTTILREVAAKFTTAVATAYATITRKFGFKNSVNATITDTDNTISQAGSNFADPAAGVQITAGIPSLTEADRAALAVLKNKRERQLISRSVYPEPLRKPSNRSPDFDM